MGTAFKSKCQKEKSDYYKNIVQDLKTSNTKDWYSKVKRMCSIGQMKNEETNVESISTLTDKEQVEVIADEFEKISHDYEPITSKSIPSSSYATTKSISILPHQVYDIIKEMKVNPSTPPRDIPMKLIKEFGLYLSDPIAEILNRGFSHGEYPECWKLEVVTPVPKVLPPSTTDDLRKIAGLKNLSKIAEKIISKFIIEDIKTDFSQYGNQKGVSINHYLVKMLNKILTELDKNSTSEAIAVIAEYIDWSKAFDRQCPILGIQSFIRNGVRLELIPILINYFQDRKMTVKWHGQFSSLRTLPGGGPQGATIGIWEYISQSTGNVDFLDPDLQYKFIDDLSVLEVINLISVGLTDYNFRFHVASDIGVDQFFLPTNNIQAQNILDKIQNWTEQNKMKLNGKKTTIMIFNKTYNYQFATRLYVENRLLEIIDEILLLGTVITNDLSWHRNTDRLVKKAYSRMTILRKLYSFNVQVKDLITIYIIYIRCLVEQSCVVWHSSLTVDDCARIERIQKVALRIVLKDEYLCYENGLLVTQLPTLKQRREQLCLEFAQSCTKGLITKSMFPLNDTSSSHWIRTREMYKVQYCRTKRLLVSSIPYMQRLLNSE